MVSSLRSTTTGYRFSDLDPVLAQLLNAGICRQCELIRAFGLGRKMLGRALRQLRDRGLDSFFIKPTDRGPAKVLTPRKRSRAQELLDEGLGRPEVCAELGIKYDTLRKAVGDGQLLENRSGNRRTASTQSERSEEDGRAGEAMGAGCTNTMDRMASAGCGSKPSVSPRTCSPSGPRKTSSNMPRKPLS